MALVSYLDSEEDEQPIAKRSKKDAVNHEDDDLPPLPASFLNLYSSSVRVSNTTIHRYTMVASVSSSMLRETGPPMSISNVGSDEPRSLESSFSQLNETYTASQGFPRQMNTKL